MAVGLCFLGIAVLSFPNVDSGLHLLPSLVGHLVAGDIGLAGTLIALLVLAFFGWLVFGVWALLTILVFSGLSRLDRDVVKHVHFIETAGAEPKPGLQGTDLTNLVVKVIALTVISAAISLLLLFALSHLRYNPGAEIIKEERLPEKTLGEESPNQRVLCPARPVGLRR